jgi:peroxiredoxin Q/BCP
LPFPLLADVGHKVADAYGVWGEKKRAGRTTMGIRRTTFLIGPDGRVLRVFENVRPDGHSREILEALGT